MLFFLPTAGSERDAPAGTSHAGAARMHEDCGAALCARAAGRTETRVEAWRTPGRSPEGGGGGIAFSLGSRLPHPIPDSTAMGQTGGGEPQRLLCRIRLLWGRPAGVVRGPPSAGQIARAPLPPPRPVKLTDRWWQSSRRRSTAAPRGRPSIALAASVCTCRDRVALLLGSGWTSLASGRLAIAIACISLPGTRR